MRLSDFWTVAVRRWYLVLASFVLSVGATLFAVNAVGSTYNAEGSVLVFPPVATVQRNPDQVVGNPYLVLDGVKQARDVVLRTLTSQAVGDDLVAQNPGFSFEATPDYTNGAPVILISVNASTTEGATRGLTAVMNEVPTILDQLQSDLSLPPEAMITSRPLFADSSPTAVHKDQIRAGIVAGVAVMGLSMLVIGLIDGLLSGRAARGRSGSSVAPADVRPSVESTPARRATEPARRLGPRTPAVPKRPTSLRNDDDFLRLDDVQGTSRKPPGDTQGLAASRRSQGSSARSGPVDADTARMK